MSGEIDRMKMRISQIVVVSVATAVLLAGCADTPPPTVEEPPPPPPEPISKPGPNPGVPVRKPKQKPVSTTTLKPITTPEVRMLAAMDPPAAMGKLPKEVVAHRLRSRPPVAPPVGSGALVGKVGPVVSTAKAGGGKTKSRLRNEEAAATPASRCQAAIEVSHGSILKFLSLPPEQVMDRAWVEEALQMTELATIGCQGQEGEATATYWRATAFYLHGQYARAALYYRRVAEMNSPFNTNGYAAGVAELLETCSGDRANLDALRVAGLHEAAGRRAAAASLYKQASTSSCSAVATRAKARLEGLEGSGIDPASPPADGLSAPLDDLEDKGGDNGSRVGESAARKPS